MDAKQVLGEAWQAVEAAGLPEHVQAVALEQAVALITREVGAGNGKPVNPAPRPPSSAPAQINPDTARGEANLDEDEFFRKFAEESDVAEDVLRSVYHVKDESVRIAVSRKSLGTSIADKSRNLAALLLGPRYYVDGKPNVTVREVREAASSQFAFDPTRNLAKYLEAVPGTISVGQGNEKSVRGQSGKFDAPFKELVERLASR
ncbi:hypothetical protein [Cellulomonas phragmiteti]|uniref:Uncharacterized protein n=1 Tax=Cellulomonas phragmiteti TaxID=478780 RepID=A0ABQ4DSK4_9CELL|nr:hypothetical protein [Cellulomonas phragmiteti]GIG41946.1 hypothetical protein Cph01nite_37080 [Cellulomonas phragmiteti]